jgi:L-malate glycosyltransferase
MVHRIRVAFGIDNMNLGGTELNAVRTAERLDRRRFDLRVVSLQTEGPLMERYAALGVPVHTFPIPSLYAPATLRQGLRLARFLRSLQVDVFHAHDMYSNMFSAPWARLAGVRGVIASRRWWEGPDRKTTLANRLSYRFAHRVLANSEGVGELVGGEGIHARRVAVIRNFLDEQAFERTSEPVLLGRLQGWGLRADHRVVGIVANLHPVKDHASLLRAVAMLAPRWPALRLVLVGDGERRNSLVELAQTLGIGDIVTFAGRLPHSADLHPLFEISVLCSLSEGLSNSILEAMAAGNPVVATRVGAAADAVVDGETGRLVPPADPAALAAAIEELLADPARARRMGEAGRARARERYAADAVIPKLEALYEELAGRR